MLNTLCGIEIVSATGILLLLFFISAPYGRHARSGWGISMPARYAWMIMEAPALAVIAFIMLSARERAGIYALGFILAWEVHYLYRTSIYPLLLTSPQKRFPLLLVFFALIFNSINGWANGLSLADKSAWYSLHHW
jgi:3-oxo-5-alpha-steroid 4-dehydrogenase 1